MFAQQEWINERTPAGQNRNSLYFLFFAFFQPIMIREARVFNQANEHPFKCWYNKIVLKLRRHMQSFFFLFHSHGRLR